MEISSEMNIRVRYSETDQMGFVYYGNYAAYFEVARTDCMKNIGICYKELEDKGFYLPVLSYSIKYKKPAHYDELLTIHTRLESVSAIRLRFLYEIYNESNDLLSKGETEHAFISKDNNRPCAAPKWFSEQLEKNS